MMTAFRAFGLMLAFLLGCCAAFAQDTATPPSPQTYTINLRDADIKALSEQVSQITGRTLVLDPTVNGTVTVISPQALDKAGVWELYQSVLVGQGFAALPSGTFWRVVPLASIREGGGTVDSDPGGTPPGKLDVITRLIALKNFPALKRHDERVPPFQGWRKFRTCDPGLCPGLSNDAPLGMKNMRIDAALLFLPRLVCCLPCPVRFQSQHQSSLMIPFRKK